MASFRTDSPIAIVILQRFSQISDPKTPMRGHLAGAPSLHSRKTRENAQKWCKHARGRPVPRRAASPDRPVARAGPRSPPLAAPARIRLCNEGAPTPGGAMPACGPLRAAIRETAPHWCIGGGCMVLRASKPDPWVPPCVVLDGFSTSRCLWVSFRSKIEA